MRDLMKIIIGTKKRTEVKVALINYYTFENGIENKKNRQYCNTLMVIARRVIYTLYNREDILIKNNIINYEFKKNIKLILNFRRTCSVFLNHNTDVWQNNMLIKP